MNIRAFTSVLALVSVSLAPVLTRGVEPPTDVAGVPASLVGLHGPTQDFLDNLELVGHTPIPVPEGVGGALIPLGNNGAPALFGTCAYVGRWHDYNTGTKKHGVQIIDVSDPANPTRLGDIPQTINSGAVAREIRVVDNGLPPDLVVPGALEDMLIVMHFSSALGSARTDDNQLQFYTFDGGDCRKPKLAGTYPMGAFRGHEFFLWIDQNGAPPGLICIEGCPRVFVFVAAPIGPPNILVVEATDPANPALVGLYDAGYPVVSPEEPDGTYLGTYAHSITLSPDGHTAYLSYWDGGVFSVDSTGFAENLSVPTFVPKGLASVPYDYSPPDRGNTHSTVKIPGRNVAVVGDEVYISVGGCPFGFMRLVDLGSETEAPHQVGEFRLEENKPENCNPVTTGANVRNSLGLPVDGSFSMHNQTVTPHYAFATWYGAGLRVVDVSDPTKAVQVGAFVPKPVDKWSSIPATSAPIWGRTGSVDDDWWVATWSYPVIRNGLIYLTDMRSGLYILQPAPGAPFAAEVAGTRFAEGNSNLGDVLPATP